MLKYTPMLDREIKTLKKLGIDTRKPIKEVLIDLINVSEFLWDKVEETEQDRFKQELERIKKPTN